MQDLTKKPKICFVTSFFYPTVGGVETHIQNTAKELIKLGYDCEAYVSDMDRDKRIKKAPQKIDNIKIKRFRSWLKFSFSGIIFPGLFKAITISNADIFHIHGYRHPFNFIFWFTKKPIFITPHWPVYKGQRAKWAQFLVDLTDKFLGKYMFKHFSKVCVVTDLETPWVESFNKKKKDIILTPNCIPEYYFQNYDGKNFRKKYDLKKDELVILTVSRLHPSKGIDQIVKTAKHFPKTKFIIMGKDGGFKPELEQLIQKLNLKNIIITGEVTEKEKLEAYAGSDIFCSPSHYEAFCISILEAMSQGCAVLTSNAGGMPWVVGNNGLTFKDYDLEDFKNQLEKLINNKELRTKFQKQGKEKSKNFKWKNTAKVLDREYKRLLKQQAIKILKDTTNNGNL